MRHLSLFAGIGGFDLGFDRAGMSTVGQIENDPHCVKVLEEHWPDAPRFGDIQEIHADELPTADIWSGGFPCQDLSIAGRRAGLDGERSGLWHHFARLVAIGLPAWLVIENVPGLLSSNDGRDMGTILGQLGQLGYGFAYRVLDAQYFGLAQRRRRVFIVANLRDRGAPSWVLSIGQASCGDPPPDRGTRPAIAATLETRPTSDRWRVEENHLIETSDGVRRLTPLECERLQGFPDGWTSALSDSRRYRTLGNAVAVPVAEWIGQRIEETQ